MKFNMPKDWCERMARAESIHNIGAGTFDHPLRVYEYEICPTCRNYNLERSWCTACDKTGFIKSISKS